MVDLVPYGIDEEVADMRAHVCVVAKRVYVFPVERLKEALSQKPYPCVPAYTEDVVTAEGYLVPPDDIEGMCVFELIDKYWTHYRIVRSMPSSLKGKRAEQLVRNAINAGRIGIPAQATSVTDLNEQIAGCDLYVQMNLKRVQVKCDFDGGHKAFGGTGNLFIQISEANPFKRH